MNASMKNAKDKGGKWKYVDQNNCTTNSQFRNAKIIAVMGHGDTRGESLMSAESAYPRDTVAVLVTALPCVDLLQDPAHCPQRRQQAKIKGGDCRVPS